MITSMTGYGDAQGGVQGIEFTVEIRCLNNRYYKPSIRLPEEFAYLEPNIDLLLRKAVSRGSLIYTLRARPAEETALVEINYPALRSFLHDLRELERDLGFEGVSIDLASLLQVPGLTRPAEQSQTRQESFKEFLVGLTNQALESFSQMRRREGQALHDDLLSQAKIVREQLEHIVEAAPEVVRSYHAKLVQRASELLSATHVTVTEDNLAREIAIFAERCDISEEIVRLQSHLDHFEKVCEGDSQADSSSSRQAGRRLDFIAQEMLREANTIGAKASDAAISTAVVDIKTAIDRIKEQAQNVE